MKATLDRTVDHARFALLAHSKLARAPLNAPDVLLASTPLPQKCFHRDAIFVHGMQLRWISTKMQIRPLVFATQDTQVLVVMHAIRVPSESSKHLWGLQNAHLALQPRTATLLQPQTQTSVSPALQTLMRHLEALIKHNVFVMQGSRVTTGGPAFPARGDHPRPRLEMRPVSVMQDFQVTMEGLASHALLVQTKYRPGQATAPCAHPGLTRR